MYINTAENVKIIQRQLNGISNNYPAIPKLKVDYPTWYRISDIYVAVSRLAELQ